MSCSSSNVSELLFQHFLHAGTEVSETRGITLACPPGGIATGSFLVSELAQMFDPNLANNSGVIDPVTVDCNSVAAVSAVAADVPLALGW